MNHRSHSSLAFVSLLVLAACGTPQHTESTPPPASSAPPSAASESPAPATTEADAGAVTEVSEPDASTTAIDASSAVADAGSAATDASVSDARSGGRTGGRSGTGTSPGGTGGTGGTTAGTGGGGNVANGRAAFQRTCNRCHPNGEEDTGPRINNINWAEARMRTQIRQGSGGMRPIPASRLSDADLTDLLAYLRTTHAVR